MVSGNMSITFDASAAVHIVHHFGWRFQNGQLVDEGGEQVLATDGEPIRLDEFAGVTPTEDGMKPVRDDFPSLVDLVADRGGE